MNHGCPLCTTEMDVGVRGFDVGGVSPPWHPDVVQRVSDMLCWYCPCLYLVSPFLCLLRERGARLQCRGIGKSNVVLAFHLEVFYTFCCCACFSVAWEASSCMQTECITPPTPAVRYGACCHPRQGTRIPRPYASTAWNSSRTHGPPAGVFLGFLGVIFPVVNYCAECSPLCRQPCMRLMLCCALAQLSA